MWSGNLVSGPGFAFIINGGHSLIGGGDYLVPVVWKAGFLFTLHRSQGFDSQTHRNNQGLLANVGFPCKAITDIS